jgi:tetratricopeptide (TPR) repeat protein
MGFKPGISFCVISGGQRPDRFEALIRSIIRLEIDDFEILVCGIYEGGESDRRVKYFEKREWAEKAEVCRMRNFNAERASYGTIIILDDDVELTLGWWKGIGKYRDFDLAGCRGVDGNGQRWWDWQKIDRDNPLAKPELLDYDQTDPNAYISGYFMMMKRRVWEAVKFDEDRRNYQHDDIDFCHRVTDMGYTLKIFPDATVIHYVDKRGREESERARKEFLRKNPVTRTESEEAQFYLSLGEYREAIPLYKKLAGKERKFSNFYNLAYSYHQLGALSNAVRYYLEAVTQPAEDGSDDVRLAAAYLHLGEIFIKKGDTALAEGSLKKALAYLPEHNKAEQLLDSLTVAMAGK